MMPALETRPLPRSEPRSRALSGCALSQSQSVRTRPTPADETAASAQGGPHNVTGPGLQLCASLALDPCRNGQVTIFRVSGPPLAAPRIFPEQGWGPPRALAARDFAEVLGPSDRRARSRNVIQTAGNSVKTFYIPVKKIQSTGTGEPASFIQAAWLNVWTVRLKGGAKPVKGGTKPWESCWGTDTCK